MRRGLCVLAMFVSFNVMSGVIPEVVVLKDGQKIELAKPYTSKGKMAILTLKDGSLRTVPLTEIDVEKTSALKAELAAPPPVAEPTRPPRTMTIAEIAAATRSSRKATVVLTDQDVARGMTVDDAELKRGQAAGDVDIAGFSANKTKTGYSIVGTVINRGNVDASGISVTIEMIGTDDKPVTTVFGQVAKPILAPGESAGFQADVATAAEAKTFKCVPTWKVISQAPAASGGTSGGQRGSAGSGGSANSKDSAEADQPPPTPAPTPAPRPTPEPRPDIASPAASAPMGEPTTPGGAYVPRGEVVGQKTPPPSN